MISWAPHKRILIGSGAGLLLLILVSVWYLDLPKETGLVGGAATANVGERWHYSFSVNGFLEETGEMTDSTSPYWWVNSGAGLVLEAGLGRTLRGRLPWYAKWRLRYLLGNPLDTDNGFTPQNIFRLVSRSRWEDLLSQVKFRVNEINLSQSGNRNESNGVLLFNRYVDSDNLYYMGVRVDGDAVIKKKKNGVYYTMAQQPVFVETQDYNPDSNPNLIPQNVWMGLRTTVMTNPDNSVTLRLYLDRNNKGSWELVAEARDDGQDFGGAPIRSSGFAGLRTDFMDAAFDDFIIEESG